ncbi:tetratricopeptide repeat protein [Kitasatospora sp. NBC_00458]|uniref:tetratricopeptide repeat protein n=1 Tax=Kitasatospora sp. NBC_00458 TaxID=2903568 RepID=UPI002E191FB9
MSTAWPRWTTGAPDRLLSYIQRKRPNEPVHGAPADLLGTDLPAPGDGPVADRVRTLYEAFAARGIVYADEATTSDPGHQTVRPPYEVLHTPRHATCLDLALAFAGACLDAGLHPLLAVVAGRSGTPAHAVVAVWLDGPWANRAHRDYRADEAEPDPLTLPEDFLDSLADTADSPGSYLALDITGASSRPGSADPRRQRTRTWEESAAHGAELLREAAESGRLAVTLDVGLGYPGSEPLPLPGQPATAVLAAPYQPLPESREETGPLTRLWARHEGVGFLDRDELDFLSSYFKAPDPGGPRSRIVLLHGTGGAGKTRLAAELAHRLGKEGWYTGFLARDPYPQDCAWLSRVASPVLVVVDYAEDHKTDDVINLLRALRTREAPTCLLLTARSVGDWWEREISTELRREGHRYLFQKLPLAVRHPRHAAVYRKALRSFGLPEPTAFTTLPPPDPGTGRWTTLDLVMLAWLTVHEQGAHVAPTAESDLYEKILEHELTYWERTYARRTGAASRRTRRILRHAGACISLLTPREDRLDDVLSAIPELARDSNRRDQIVALFEELLPTTPEDGTVSVRPDPLGTHLTSTVFAADSELLKSCLDAADQDERINACVGISRVATSPDDTSGRALATLALEGSPELWQTALAVATAQGGPFVGALENLALADPSPLPLGELAFVLPTGHGALRRLALIAAERGRAEYPDDASEESRSARANWLNSLSIRQAEAGERQGALTTITEAVDIYRTLAHDNPTAFLPNLAGSLNSLSNRQADAGERQGALTTITEAVDIYRTLAHDNPTAFLPDLAMSLNNLSNRQAGAGDRQGALTTITEAVDIYRTLAHDNPTAFLPDLAMSLNNLSVRQADAGERQGALTTITEAVDIYRTLAHDNPITFLPNLASALNNLSGHQADAGDRQAALTTITEATTHYHALAHDNPTAFLPDLASTLNNLSNRLAGAGERQGALTTVTEAVEIRRTLAHDNPTAFLPDLAMSLNNLSVHQSEAGERQGALTTITEAVDIYRTLAHDNPTAFLPDLAGSLNNLSGHQADAGERQGALTTITEAVDIYRTLAHDNPTAFLPDLAGSLNNLSSHQAHNGERQAALTTITEAVDIHRTLAHDNPTAFLPNLAMSLNNLSVRQAEAGDRRAALTTVTEAVEIRRTLAHDNPTAFLPDLASALNNLSVRQAEAGDRQAALTTITEAVDIRRTLAHDNPTAFLPDLAMSLNNLSNRQAHNGERQAALTTITEAVDIYRTLAHDNPTAFLPNLAMSLNNLSNQQAEAGDRQAALTTITEAVDIYRTLAHDNPTAFLPDLAMSLNNLSNRQAHNGERQAALTTITEAVDIYRTLAHDNPTAFLPDLASTLNNLSNRQAEAGDRQAALTTITEAVDIRRTLAHDNPTAFLPDLAMSLNNLSNRQAEAGDRQAALTTITEAVDIYRTLAHDNPTAFLPNLASTLNNLSNHQTDIGDRQAALQAWDQAISESAPGPAAVLLVQRARWRMSQGHDHLGITADLTAAAHSAEATTDPAWIGPARREVRAFTEEHREVPHDSPDLPSWATADLPQESVDRLNQWLGQTRWLDRETFLRQHAAQLATPTEREVLDVSATLFPEATGLVELAGLLRAVEEHGLEAVLNEQRSLHSAFETLSAWLATPTWPEDLAYLLAHPELEHDPLVRRILSDHPSDPAARLHLGILQLLAHVSAPEVYDAVTDPPTAVDLAVDLIKQGRPEAIAPFFMAVPALAGVPFWAPYLLAVHILCCDPAGIPGIDLSGVDLSEGGSPDLLFARAAREGTPVLRAAGASHLRNLAARRPQDSPALLGYTGTFAESPTAPEIGPGGDG